MREQLFTCEGCGAKILDGDKYHAGVDVELCEECAPDFEDMVKHPEMFMGDDDQPMLPEEAKRKFDAHISSGGLPTDKMVAG